MITLLEIIGIINFIGVVIAQFIVLPPLASGIERRFQKLDIPIKCNPTYAEFTLSRFWLEARKLNRTLKDPIINQLLKKRIKFYIYGGISVIFLTIIWTLDGILG
jgi:hypothetical protein